MHELGITRNLVAIVSEAAQGRTVRKVWLEIGSRSALMPEAVRFCFDIVSQGTPLASATLEIVAIEPGWRCTACGAAASEEPAPTHCPACGGETLRRCSGEELNIKAMEVEPCA